MGRRQVRGKGRLYTGNKALVMAAVERGGQVRIKTVRSRNGVAIQKFMVQHVDDSVKFVYTDEHAA